LELFKKTLPSPAAASFLQIDGTAGDARRAALAALRSSPRGDPRVGFLELAFRGQKQGFDKLAAKIDELGGILVEEQKEDDRKKAFCTMEIDREEDEVKAAVRAGSDKSAVIADLEDSLQEVNRGISSLLKGIKELDKQVSEATATRKAEHAESVDILAQNSAAKSLLELAKNRLFQYYNKKLARTEGATTAAPTLVQEGAVPEADLKYEKKSAENGGVLAMVDLLRTELVKKITTLETEEKGAQAAYEKFVKDSSEKRALDSKAVADKDKAKAEVEASLLEEKDTLASHETDAAANKEELKSLHADCDWLLQNFNLRKQARNNEADALQKAKAVLSGADYS